MAKNVRCDTATLKMEQKKLKAASFTTDSLDFKRF